MHNFVFKLYKIDTYAGMGLMSIFLLESIMIMLFVLFCHFSIFLVSESNVFALVKVQVSCCVLRYISVVFFDIYLLCSSMSHFVFFDISCCVLPYLMFCYSISHVVFFDVTCCILLLSIRFSVQVCCPTFLCVLSCSGVSVCVWFICPSMVSLSSVLLISFSYLLCWVPCLLSISVFCLQYLFFVLSFDLTFTTKFSLYFDCCQSAGFVLVVSFHLFYLFSFVSTRSSLCLL